MNDIVALQPHDPLPEGPAVTVLRRFDEQAPQGTVIDIIIVKADGTERDTLAAHLDGTPMTWDEAIDLASRRAAEEGIDRVTTIDRMAGPREEKILNHNGDHTIDMGSLQDTDEEDAVRGSDLRDRGNDGGPRKF